MTLYFFAILFIKAKSPLNDSSISYVLIFSIATNHRYSCICAKNVNKLQHCSNGNIKGTNLSIFHWNKGNSLFVNKIDDIHFILDKYRPKVLSISEANFDTLNPIKFNVYKVE